MREKIHHMKSYTAQKNYFKVMKTTTHRGLYIFNLVLIGACLQKRDGKGELSVVLVDDTEQRKNFVQPREADKPDQHGKLDREIATSKPNMHGTAGDVCTVVNIKPPSETPPPAALGKERVVHQKEPKKYKRQNVKRTFFF
jgi:hypothetical protein